ncbi:hypothetical protein D6D01_04760 [Aureobasidium pullulans]|uniref:Uncharacterized protein n=1 Tax=Aureobasidium pullulans TaxID=5580 RepID=A0A4S9LB99_AURPU|nr:hypothetical protein D6D01_04760 [Aureobasidium pullulans]
MSASQQPLAISPNANRLAVVYRHRFVVSFEYMEENESQQGYARDQIRRRDEARPSSGVVQPRQVQRGRLNTKYGHVMPQESIAAWPFLYVMLHTYGRTSLKDQFEKRRNQTANFWKSQLLVLRPAGSQPCGHATLTCQDSYLAGRSVARLLGTNIANTWNGRESGANPSHESY